MRPLRAKVTSALQADPKVRIMCDFPLLMFWEPVIGQTEGVSKFVANPVTLRDGEAEYLLKKLSASKVGQFSMPFYTVASFVASAAGIPR